ncbi:MAG: isoprenylcysteine carboxyl methyltransferase [Robiginitomaculum sp.]|nr:MAG: isoprenylcysteine carboxyl methyltransferase [Robiginitomaculum sp.]
MSGKDNPGVHFPPPLMFFLSGLVGWQAGLRLGWLVFVPSTTIQMAALGLIVAGLALGAWSMFPFFAAGTSLLPWEPDSQLLTAGPYRFSRNPMYAGMALLYGGVCLQLGSGLALALILPLILLINRYVIAGEEAYLTRTFGETYQAYQGKVRRWL